MHVPFVLFQLKAQFALFSPRVAVEGNFNIISHFSSTSIQVLTAVNYSKNPNKRTMC